MLERGVKGTVDDGWSPSINADVTLWGPLPQPWGRSLGSLKPKRPCRAQKKENARIGKGKKPKERMKKTLCIRSLFSVSRENTHDL